MMIRAPPSLPLAPPPPHLSLFLSLALSLSRLLSGRAWWGMPLGKYYCDYCEKQFQDTPSARKRHLEGVQHQRAKALWYASVHSGGLDAAAGGLPPRGVCHHFVRTGFCQFGDGCKYFHPKQNVPSEHQVMTGPTSAPVVHAPSSVGNQLIGRTSLGNMVDRTEISWGNLPPSLRPPPEGGYPPLPFIDWG